MPDDDDQTLGAGAGGFDDNGALDRLDDEEDREGTTATPEEVIALILDESQPIPFHDLPALSSADNETAGNLLSMWPRISAARRREVLATLQRQAEDDSTLDYDRLVKGPLYARHGICEYWVIDVGARLAWVHRGPTSNGWASVEKKSARQRIHLSTLPEVSIRLADLD